MRHFLHFYWFYATHKNMTVKINATKSNFNAILKQSYFFKAIRLFISISLARSFTKSSTNVFPLTSKYLFIVNSIYLSAVSISAISLKNNKLGFIFFFAFLFLTGLPFIFGIKEIKLIEQDIKKKITATMQNIGALSKIVINTAISATLIAIIAPFFASAKDSQ